MRNWLETSGPAEESPVTVSFSARAVSLLTVSMVWTVLAIHSEDEQPEKDTGKVNICHNYLVSISSCSWRCCISPFFVILHHSGWSYKGQRWYLSQLQLAISLHHLSPHTFGLLLQLHTVYYTYSNCRLELPLQIFEDNLVPWPQCCSAVIRMLWIRDWYPVVVPWPIFPYTKSI